MKKGHQNEIKQELSDDELLSATGGTSKENNSTDFTVECPKHTNSKDCSSVEGCYWLRAASKCTHADNNLDVTTDQFIYTTKI